MPDGSTLLGVDIRGRTPEQGLAKRLIRNEPVVVGHVRPSRSRRAHGCCLARLTGADGFASLFGRPYAQTAEGHLPTAG
jgi:hypothetical protein